VLYNQIRFQVRLAADWLTPFPYDVHSETVANTAIYGSLTMTRPSTNNLDPVLEWETGTVELIQWSRQGASMGAVNLFYSNDGGLDLFVHVIDNSGTIPSSDGPSGYSWTIPSDTSVFNVADKGKNTQILIKVVSDDFPSQVLSESAQPLTIKSKLFNLSPSSGKIFVGTTDYDISWATNGDIPTVNIKYDTLGAGTYTGGIATAISNVGGYTWPQINSPLGTQIRIKVESVDHPGDIFIASSNLTAKGKLAITVPTAANVNDSALIATDTFRIQWTVNGGVGKTGSFDLGNLDIYYAPDGVSWENGSGSLGVVCRLQLCLPAAIVSMIGLFPIILIVQRIK